MSAAAAKLGTTVERLGVLLRARDAGPDPRVLLGLALRDNPRRAQLLVSRVLGKHVPTDPRLVHAAGLLLGGLVADALADQPHRRLPVDLLHAAVRGERGAAAALHVHALQQPAERAGDALVIGFAETATALGHSVAEALCGVDYLHSTRRQVPGVTAAGGFTEEHSHHTDHLLLPSDPGLLAGPRPLVLVDDELSTGRTAVNTIAALHRVAPRERYVLATLVDLREDALTGLPDGVRVDVVALARAAVTLPADVAERAAVLRAELAHTADADRGAEPRAAIAMATASGRGPRPPSTAEPHTWVPLTELGWPRGLPAGGRHGFTAAHHRVLAQALPGLAARLAVAADVRADERTLVLGTEELMAVPLRLAVGLAALQQGDTAATQSEECHPAAIRGAEAGVRFSTTTRSPALVVDEPDYALTSGITFPAHDDPADGPGPRYAYNVARSPAHDDPAHRPGPRPACDHSRAWDHVLVVVDPPADTPTLRTGLLAALAPHTRRTTVVVTP